MQTLQKIRIAPISSPSGDSRLLVLAQRLAANLLREGSLGPAARSRRLVTRESRALRQVLPAIAQILDDMQADTTFRVSRQELRSRLSERLEVPEALLGAALSAHLQYLSGDQSWQEGGVRQIRVHSGVDHWIEYLLLTPQGPMSLSVRHLPDGRYQVEALTGTSQETLTI